MEFNYIFAGAVIGHLISKMETYFSKIELIELDYKENKRIYYYPDNTSVIISNVTHFKSSKTTHRLKTEDEKLHIIKDGWRRIEIRAEEFTV